MVKFLKLKIGNYWDNHFMWIVSSTAYSNNLKLTKKPKTRQVGLVKKTGVNRQNPIKPAWLGFLETVLFKSVFVYGGCVFCVE